MRTMLLWTLLLAVPVSAQTPASSFDSATIDGILASPAAQRGVWGIVAVDLATGQTVYEKNAQLPMTPASNTKLFSTALALTRLGPGHRFRTRVLASATVGRNGVLSGDLVLVGGGDPTLSARPVPYRKGPVEGDELAPLRALARQVAASGLRRVEGDLVADDTLFPWEPLPGGWAIGDVEWEYGAPVSAFVIHDNAFRLGLQAPANPGEPVSVTISPPAEYFTLDNRIRVEAGARREVEVRRHPGSSVLQLMGTLPPGAASSSLLALDDPARYAGFMFRRLLAEEGVSVAGRVVVRHREPGHPYREPTGALLAQRESPPLIEILTTVNKVSQNLHAEIVFREAARVKRGDATPEFALEELAELAKEASIAPEWFDLSDGSGLSRRGLVAPAAIVRLLTYLHQSPHRDAFYRTLPIAGFDGTLERRFRGLGDVSALRAKTGSLTHVNALGGYIGNEPERRYAFAILANHTTASSFEIRNLIDKIGKVLLTERAK